MNITLTEQIEQLQSRQISAKELTLSSRTNKKT